MASPFVAGRTAQVRAGVDKKRPTAGAHVPSRTADYKASSRAHGQGGGGVWRGCLSSRNCHRECTPRSRPAGQSRQVSMSRRALARSADAALMLPLHPHAPASPQTEWFSPDRDQWQSSRGSRRWSRGPGSSPPSSRRCTPSPRTPWARSRTTSRRWPLASALRVRGRELGGAPARFLSARACIRSRRRARTIAATVRHAGSANSPANHHYVEGASVTLGSR